ncbi:4936_t:CDS:2, partial [Acaulospora colombiana]
SIPTERSASRSFMILEKISMDTKMLENDGSHSDKPNLDSPANVDGAKEVRENFDGLYYTVPT